MVLDRVHGEFALLSDPLVAPDMSILVLSKMMDTHILTYNSVNWYIATPHQLKLKHEPHRVTTAIAMGFWQRIEYTGLWCFCVCVYVCSSDGGDSES